MKKLFFSALVALVAGSAAVASVGNTTLASVYARPAGSATCQPINNCSNIPTAIPCQTETVNGFYLNPNCTSPTAAYELAD